MEFASRYFAGTGDVQYLRLLNDSRRFFAPSPELENLSMLYTSTWHGRSWDGLEEGLAWDAWWIQNSYGATYSALPFLEEPYLTFLQHSQDLWFDQMGNGKHVGAAPPFNWVAPNGSLCDCAQPGRIIYKQGDGRIQIHDWRMEMTATGNLARRVTPLEEFCRKMQATGWGACYKAAHARLELSCIATVLKRHQLLESGKLKALPRRSEAAADKLYKNTAINLGNGLVTVLRKDAQSTNAYQLKVASMWSAKVGGHHG